jgi:hypothetical protein
MQGLHLEHANFHQAILAQADLSGAHLEGANFCRTDLYETNFQNAFLARANLQGVQMVRTDLAGADLRGCKVYGLSAWDLCGNAERLVRLTKKGKEGIVYGGGNSATQAVIDAVRNGAKKITIISRHALEHGASADQVERLEALQRKGKVKILTDEIKRLIPGQDGKVAAVETKGGEVIKAAHVETFLDSKQQLIVRYRPSYARRPNRDDEEVQVESLDLAAFMYLTLNNRNISRIIEAAGRKWVLLLGRFTQRKSVLKAVAEALKQRQFTPIIFDFPPPEQRELIETVMLLAGMSALVIVEITNPRSTPMELQAIASNYGVPVVPVMKQGAKEFGTFSGLRKFPWVHSTITYDTTERLIARLQKDVIGRLTARKPMV